MTIKSERDKFKDHFDGILNLIFWIWRNKFVFVVMGSVWTACFGAILNYALIPAALPVVQPIIKQMWTKQVAPYDSIVADFNKRISILENED